MQDLVVIILTLDEELNLPAALASVGGRADVLVLDSISADATQQIAREGGAEVHQRAFDNYAAQRNHALELVRDRYRWTLFLDADERLTPPLWEEIEEVVRTDAADGAYIGWIFEVLGRRMKHGSFGAAANLRLVRTEQAHFRRPTHERIDDRGMRIVSLRNKIVHADAKPLAEWFRKHIRYAEWEAKHYVEGTDRDKGLEDFSWKTKRGRMVALRWAYNKMPLMVRPLIHLTRTVVLQSAWRDGIPGLLYAGMQSFWYPLVIDLMIVEERWRREQERQG